MNLVVWTVTDGKAGDRAQAEGLAQAILAHAGGRLVRHDIAPRQPWRWVAPFGPPDPREDPRRPGRRLGPPHPDIVIGTGRRAVPVLRAFRGLAPPRPFTVFLKNPRIAPASAADLVWAPAHDGLAGPNVVATLTAPHRFSAERLAAARAAQPAVLARLKRPLLAVALGGPGRGTAYTRDDLSAFARALSCAGAAAGSIVAAPSRRTPPGMIAAVRNAIAALPGFVWDGAGENPYEAMLANADMIVVTGDSHNMVSEALAAGAPVAFVRPSRLNARLSRFLDAVEAQELALPFDGRLETLRRGPLDCTHDIAAAALAAYADFRAGARCR